VDLAIDPPSFGVQLDATGAIRETEAPRLQLRRPEDAASPVQQPQPTVASASTAATVSSPAPVLANGALQRCACACRQIRNFVTICYPKQTIRAYVLGCVLCRCQCAQTQAPISTLLVRVVCYMHD